MQKFLYEKYETKQRGRTFTGYIEVLAESSEEAKEKAQTKAGEDVFLCQIYTP